MRITLAALALATMIGCGGGGGSSSSTETPKPVQLDNISFTATPTKARINEKIELKVEELNKKTIPFFSIDTDDETDSNKDSNPANDVDLKDQNKTSALLSTSYSQPGFYTLVLSSTNSRGVLGEKRLKLLVKPNDFFTNVQEAISNDFKYIKKSDFNNLVMPHLDSVDQTFFNSLESTITSSLTNGDTIDGFGFKSDEFVVGVNSPSSRFKDDDKDGQKDFSGSIDQRLLDPAGVRNIYDFLTAKAVDDDLLRIARAASPINSSITGSIPQTNNDISLTLINYGDIRCNFIINYILKGNQVNIGVVLDTNTSQLIQQDKDIITAFNKDFRNKGSYIPLSVVVLKDGSLYDTVKAISDELKYHKANNP